MSRKAARQTVIQLSFANAFGSQEPAEVLEQFFSEEHLASLNEEDLGVSTVSTEKDMEYVRKLVHLISENRDEIDGFIERYSNGWKIERLSKTALAVMRCAICEILYVEDVPASVAVNEAVELAKNYDEPETVSFINGVLGGFVRNEVKTDEQ